MTKNELKTLIRLAIDEGDMLKAQMYSEQLKKELENDLIIRAADAKNLDDFISTGIFFDDY